MTDWHRYSMEPEWITRAEKEDAEERLFEACLFLDGSRIVARVVWILKGKDSDVEELIDWIMNGGLERNAEAAKIARREYERFLASMPQIPAEEAVESMLFYYQGLKNVFEERGVIL